jgi:hypothetical protein
MSFSNTECQHSTEDVAETLQNIEYTVLTWPSAAHTNEDRRLRKSMVESLESILAHLQSDDDVSLSFLGLSKTRNTPQSWHQDKLYQINESVPESL